jgi:hypothetical protein
MGPVTIKYHDTIITKLSPRYGLDIFIAIIENFDKGPLELYYKNDKVLTADWSVNSKKEPTILIRAIKLLNNKMYDIAMNYIRKKLKTIIKKEYCILNEICFYLKKA